MTYGGTNFNIFFWESTEQIVRILLLDLHNV